ncbi:unnamed protein product [Adineta ricciae]|uniref:Transient receptor potential cation channel subfamily M member 3 n=1 Tax=Adineta ricciae TaxID=249248 RepID=A0A814TW21_ADIRI|nr:unnamed protein product [Adineta ricciae]
MSDEHQNSMGPVMDATPEIQELSERPEIKHAAIHELHKKHHENQVHHFTEEHREKHIAAWKVTKYAEEVAAYGINYFMKVFIGDGLFIHIRVHRQAHHAKYDFYSLHETFKHDVATCVFTEGIHNLNGVFIQEMAGEIAEQMRNVQKKIKSLAICQQDASNELTMDFGFLKFDENELDSSTRLSEYIRLSLNTSAETVVKFMKDGWGLPNPDLIISVTGGAKSFEMSTRLKKVFQRGLVAAAVNTNAWLITAGTNAGVVKEVGEALNNYRYKNEKHGLDVPCIGIGSWGYTAGNELLSKPASIWPTSMNGYSKGSHLLMKSMRSQSLDAIHMDVADEYCVRNYVVKEKLKKRCDLEPNHTHFLLFDDGGTSADTVLPLRAEIEKYCRHSCSQTVVEDETEQTLIPIVMVLVEGGPSSIRTICQALDSNTPVVVVKDSGRAADLVAELYACYPENENNTGNNIFPLRPQTAASRSDSREVEINKILTKAKNDNAWIDEIKSDLCRVLSERHELVTIFKFDGKKHNGNLEDAILEALFNAAKFSGDTNEQHRRTAELKLALAWHKFDYTQNYLLTDTTISKWKEPNLRRALVDALRRGHVDFVELLIEFGTSLENLTVADLKELYKTANTSNALPLKIRAKRDASMRDLFYLSYFKSLCNGAMVDRTLSLKDEQRLGKSASRDLFLWAIFLDRFELATYLCSKTWNSSVAPLFGALIYRRAARLTLDSEMKQQYMGNADQLDNYAASIIDRCFDNDEEFAVDMLKRPSTVFYNITPLQLALKSNCRSFIASKCVQRYIDNEWYGHINYKRQAIHFRVFLCSLFLPLLPIFCFFLPYVQKHKRLVRSARDPSTISQPTMIHSVIQPGLNRGRVYLGKVDKIAYFYRAPIVRFYYYTIFFVIFLGLFSFVLLADYFPWNNYQEQRSGIQGLHIPIPEIFLHICLWCLAIEEARQLISVDSKREFFSRIWNIIDVLGIVLYVIGFITRFFVNESLFTISKIFLCLDLILWYVRTLNLFAAYEKFGLKLFMIFNTMRDLLFFICFILIFLYGFSVASWSLINTANQVFWNYNSDGSLYNVSTANDGNDLWTWQTIRDVTNYGVWKVFGQVDPINGNDSYSDVAFVLAILFVAIANVLLLNVLVALFNLTIQNVQNQSHVLWRYQRFLLVAEYRDKPLLPPPFNIFYYLFVFLRYIIRKMKSLCCRCRRSATVSGDNVPIDRIDVSESIIQREEFKVTDAMQRESAIADDYWGYTLKHGKKDQMEIALHDIEEKLHDVRQQLQMIHTGSNNNNYQPLNNDRNSCASED